MPTLDDTMRRIREHLDQIIRDVRILVWMSTLLLILTCLLALRVFTR